MESITVLVGSVIARSSGQVNDHTQPVEFKAEELAVRTEYSYDDGEITDSRGVTETLYRTDNDRLIVHIEDWSRWRGEPTHCALVEIEDADLEPEGRWAALGVAAEMSRPLTLDEGLAACGEGGQDA